MDEFSSDITAWCSEAQDWIGETIANEAKILFSRVIEYSPRQGIARYATGHFIHNWTVSPSPIYAEQTGTATSSQKIAEINSTLHGDYFFVHPKVFLTNATSYAGTVELEGWVNTGAYAPVTKAFASIMQGD